MFKFFLAFGSGAALAYFLDPDRGRRRRHIARDRFAAALRRFGWNASKVGRHAADAAYGMGQEAVHAVDIREALDDATLARKVESEIFRDLLIPKGSINVNAEEGVVVLRGQVERPEQIKSIEDSVRRIPDVLDVQNFLHMPGEAAPNKAESMTAERPPTRSRRAPTEAQTPTEEYPAAGGTPEHRAA